MIQKLSNQDITIQPLPTDQTPISLLDYKVSKSNIEQYGQLTGVNNK